MMKFSDNGWLQSQVDAVEAGILDRVLVPRGLFRLMTNVRIRKSNVLIVGVGKGHQHDAVGPNDCSTGFSWEGPSGGTMFEWAPSEGPAERRISGGGIVGCGLYGNGVAGVGVSVRSTMNGLFDFYGEDFTDTVMSIGVVSALGEARDSQSNEVSLRAKQVGAGSGTILKLSGDVGANASWNCFHIIHGLYKHSPGLDLYNSDNNSFERTWLFRFGGGTAQGVVLRGGNPPSRANRFHQLYPGDGGILIEPESYRNIIDVLDNENYAGVPNVLPGNPAQRRLTWGNWDGERHLW